MKQLSAKSRQGNGEFLNEVTLITGVQHRNLVKLRGCSLKGSERLLVYEYLENRSLYQALFSNPPLHPLACNLNFVLKELHKELWKIS